MGSIKKAFKKVFKISSGGSSHSSPAAPERVVPAPAIGVVNEDPTNTTESESESEKQQLTKGKKRGKKSLKINLGGTSSGRNIV